MIFLDTGYFKGLMDDKDSNHKSALKIQDFLQDLNEVTVINATVIVETLNWSVGSNDSVRDIFNNLRDENMVISLTCEDYINSLEINGWYGNTINYSDCTIIIVFLLMFLPFDGLLFICSLI